MAFSTTVSTRFMAKDGMTAVFKRMQGSASAATRIMNKKFARVERGLRSFKKRVDSITPSLGKLGKQALSMAGGLAIGAIVTLAGNSILQYEDSIASLSAITGQTGAALDAFKMEVNSVAKETKKSSIEVAKAFELVGSAQPELLKDAKALGAVTNAAITLSKASRDSLEVSTANLTGTMNQFSLGADEATRVMNVLAAGSVEGSANITQVSESMKNFGTVAAGANMSVEQAVAGIETLAKFSIKGAEAGTKMRGVVLQLQKAGLGYASGQFNINDALADYQKKAKGFRTEAEKDAFATKTFGAENITAGKIMANNIDLFKDLTRKVTGTNTALVQAETNSDTLKNRFTELKNAFITYTTTNTAGNKGLTMLKDLLVKAANNMDKIIKVALIFIKVLAGLFIIAKLITLIQTVIAIYKAWMVVQVALNAAMTANPIGAIIMGIVALIAAIVWVIFHWEQFKATVTDVTDSTAFKILSLLNPIMLVIGIMFKLIASFENIRDAFKSGGIVNGFKEIGKVLLSMVLKPLQGIFDVMNKLGMLKGAGAQLNAFVAKLDGDKDDSAVAPKRPINPEASADKTTVERLEQVRTDNLVLDVNAPNGTVASGKTPKGVKLSINETGGL